jgi:hypothetical protein
MLLSHTSARRAGLVAAGLLVGCLCAPAQEPKDKDKDAEAAKRLEFMTRKLDEFTLATDKEPDKVLKRLKEPVARYTNPARNTFTYGAFYLWVSDERPVAAATVWIDGGGGVHREFSTLTDQALVCTRNDKAVWSPKAGQFARKPLPDAPKPAGTPALRLTQMRRQAERFTADFEIKSVKGKEELRLMPQPLHRYTAEKGAVEGAVFALAHNSDPELLVMLELAGIGGDKPVWSYGPARMSSAKMRLRLDGKEVWERDYYWGNPRADTDPYLEAGDGRYPGAEPPKKP